MSEQIVLNIGVDGAIHAETKGMKGPKCLNSLELLEDLLDAQITQSAFTDEYTQSATTSEVDDGLSQF
ncbi:DUF2997 domain-containing protein [Nocardioides anomalus]|uniref:DUF2997 domain-containing protein n=1 Tax=Nocardioides anomalus TaxID=2712223 RepID=A0A6G6WH42_9ACTN|nr:DUF2997 domain-containing protein [Nocardioides anomalus]QIG44477.1 DUF2997 domain-containing protein [Nocardioides anomalus]